MLEEASIVGKIRGKITLVLLAALLACVLPFTLSAQGENNLNGYNLNGELLTAGTSESDEALFSGNRIFAQNQTGLQANFAHFGQIPPRRLTSETNFCSMTFSRIATSAFCLR